MNMHLPPRSRFLSLALVVFALALSGCNGGADDSGTSATDTAFVGKIFGNGFNDNSTVVARVGDLDISQNDLELRFKEFPSSMQKRYSGEDRDRRVLRYMIDEALMVQGSLEMELFRNSEISQHLISLRRDVLKKALTDFALMENLEPTEEQVRDYFKANRDEFMMQGVMYVRHIPCVDEETANTAYALLLEGGKEGHFEAVVARFSTNAASASNRGELGWFNKGGFIPMLPNYVEFTNAVWDLEVGLHEPMFIDGEWHVIEVTNRKYERRQTLDEARKAITQELLPSLRLAAVDDFLAQARQNTEVEYFGRFRPGQGRSDREIFESAFYAKDPRKKLDFYQMLIEDFPQSELRDDAMLMIANVYFDELHDHVTGLNMLGKLIKQFPDSELADDARYLLENNGSPGVFSEDDSQ